MTTTDAGAYFRTQGVVLSRAVEHLARRRVIGVGALLGAHRRGEWGFVDPETRRVNDDGLLHGGDLLSRFRIGPEQDVVLVFTLAALGRDPRVRPLTVLFVPTEAAEWLPDEALAG